MVAIWERAVGFRPRFCMVRIEEGGEKEMCFVASKGTTTGSEEEAAILSDGLCGFFFFVQVL